MKIKIGELVFEYLDKIESDPSLRQKTIRNINHLLLVLFVLASSFYSQVPFALICIAVSLIFVLIWIEHNGR